MKELLKWGLILGGGALVYWNLYGDQEAAPADAGGSGPQQTGSTGGGSSQGSNSSGSSASQTSTSGPIRTKLANVAGPLNFWHWTARAGVNQDPFHYPRFAGKSVPEVENDLLTLDQYLAITGLSGLRGLGCTGPVPIGSPCGCGQWGDA